MDDSSCFDIVTSTTTTTPSLPFCKVRFPITSKQRQEAEGQDFTHVNLQLSRFQEEGKHGTNSYSLDVLKTLIGEAFVAINGQEAAPFRLCFLDDEGDTVQLICSQDLECVLRHPPSCGLLIGVVVDSPSQHHDVDCSPKEEVVAALEQEHYKDSLRDEIRHLTGSLQDAIRHLGETLKKKEHEDGNGSPPLVPQQPNPYSLADSKANCMNGCHFKHFGDSICALVFRSWNDSAATWDVSHLVPGWYSVTAECHAADKMTSKSVKAGVVQWHKEPNCLHIAKVVEEQLAALDGDDDVFDHELGNDCSNTPNFKSVSLGTFEVTGKDQEYFVVSMASQNASLYLNNVEMMYIRPRHP